MHKLRTALIIATLLFAASSCKPGGSHSISKTGDTLKITLDNGVDLSFALQGDLLLGMDRAGVQGISLTSGNTSVRPFIAEEFREGGYSIGFMKFKGTRLEGNRVIVECELLGTNDRRAFQEEFVLTYNEEFALKQDPDGGLHAMKDSLEEARGLWLSDTDSSGVLFCYNDQYKLPSGVRTDYILDKGMDNALRAFHTYKVYGENLQQSFGLSKGQFADERVSQE